MLSEKLFEKKQNETVVVYMYYLTPEWTHFGLLRNLLYCLHVRSEVKFHPGLKDRGEISTRGEITCF